MPPTARTRACTHIHPHTPERERITEGVRTLRNWRERMCVCERCECACVRTYVPFSTRQYTPVMSYRRHIDLPFRRPIFPLSRVCRCRYYGWLGETDELRTLPFGNWFLNNSFLFFSVSGKCDIFRSMLDKRWRTVVSYWQISLTEH